MDFFYGIIGYNNDNSPNIRLEGNNKYRAIYLVSTSNPKKLVTNC